MWAWLFSGTAQVPFRQLWNWPLRMGLEMMAAKRLYDAEIEKLEAKARAEAEAEMGREQTPASKPWWETNIGLR